MARRRKRGEPGPPTGSEAWRELVSEGTRAGNARRKERLTARPRELERLRREGLMAA